MFTKIFCPNDAHTSPARAYATIVPRCIKDNFEYETEVIWSISRTGNPMKANDKPKIDATNLAEFYGDAGVGTAEDISFLKARPQ